MTHDSRNPGGALPPALLRRRIAAVAPTPLASRPQAPSTGPVRFEPLASRTYGPVKGPFDDLGRCLLAAVLSLLTIAVVAVYLLVPITPSCAAPCTAPSGLQLAFDVLSVGVLIISAYFIGLYLVGLSRSRTRPGATGYRPFFVLVTPAHNEELVIQETTRRLLDLDYPDYLAMVVNDGSRDRTSELARATGAGDSRLLVVDRPPEIAGQGKGEVLNEAYTVVMEMLGSGDPRLKGAAEEDIVLCVVDADGWLRADALTVVADYYADARIAGVQLPVRMYNARKGFLSLMQDIEFVGFALLLQGGRDRFGSVLLGGNGQFVRLKALTDLGPKPWTRSLVEDLDIGLSLVKLGWRNRLCPHTCVAQQAVSSSRRLLRQRTRWVQGHYAAWTHLPGLWRSWRIPAIVRIDLSLHLILAVTVLVVTAQALVGVAAILAGYPLADSLLARATGTSGIEFRAVVLLLACGPLSLLAIAYHRAAVHFDGRSEHKTPLWALPGVYATFVNYTYFWGIPCSLRAFGRLALRRDAWDKTARDAVPVASGGAFA